MEREREGGGPGHQQLEFRERGLGNWGGVEKGEVFAAIDGEPTPGLGRQTKAVPTTSPLSPSKPFSGSPDFSSHGSSTGAERQLERERERESQCRRG